MVVSFHDLSNGTSALLNHALLAWTQAAGCCMLTRPAGNSTRGARIPPTDMVPMICRRDEGVSVVAEEEEGRAGG